MKFSYNWLRELVDGLDASPKDIERDITIHTAECEGVETHGDDFVIEVDNKSLTHRPDLWGHFGMAREVAAITGRPLKDPVKPLNLSNKEAPIKIVIEDYDLSPRYSALAFENVTVQASPAWLQQHLEAVGVNPINNIVDVTNFVMAELAQPMHAFDAAKVADGPIYVRNARQNEHIATLNGETYGLDSSSLVIADINEAIAIAGVIGGADSAITRHTHRLLLESANFKASNIRKTSARIKLRTDASMRFEKAQDPLNTVRALERAWELLQVVSPGIRMIGDLADAYRPAPTQPPIVLQLSWLGRKLGRILPAQEVQDILEALMFRVEVIDEDNFVVFVPSWRATKDISLKEDLVEEVGRMVGYDSITPVAPRVEARVPPSVVVRTFFNRVRDEAIAQGFTEVYNYSFVSEEMLQEFSFDRSKHVQVLNPIAANQTLLRTSLLPGILQNIRDNVRHFDTFRLFEIGTELHLWGGEEAHFVAALFAKDDGVQGLFELKRLAECLLSSAEIRPATDIRPYEHPQRTANVVWGNAAFGRLFELHPKMLAQGRAAILDLELPMLRGALADDTRYQPLRRFPSSDFDLSVIVGPRVLIADIETAIKKLGGGRLISVQFLRDFALPSGDRSLSYRLTVGASDRTLSAEEVTAVRTAVIEGLQAAGYELRV